MYDAVAALPRVSVEERLTGRPSFPMASLAIGDNLERFTKILDVAVDQMVSSHRESTGPQKPKASQTTS
jgi:hypothetical protein